jgi:hypothetical protein
MTVFKKVSTAIVGTLMALTVQAYGADCDLSPCAETNCCTQNSYVSLRGEWLYWRPELCGLEAAFGTTTIATTVSTDAITTTTVTESDEEPHSRWNSGFRVGASSAYNAIDVDLDWTHFNGRANFHKNPQNGHWKIKYDVIDLTFGRTFCLTPCVTVKPYIGVRGARIHQNLKSHLTTLFTALIGDNTVTTDKDDSEKFWGVGPELGFEADWNIGCNFSLYGSFAVVTYYGKARNKNFNTDTFTTTVSVCNGKKKHCFNNVGTDAALGIRWDTSMDCFCGCLDLYVKLGAEQHRIYDFSELGSDGTLSLDGGVLGAGISYDF